MASFPSPFARLEAMLTKGNLWLYILSTLKKKKIYAYALRETIRKKFGWEHGLITSYLVLYRLEAEGLLSSYFEGRRKYYRITQKGRKALSEAKNYLKKLSAKL